jgi:PHP domain
VTRPRLAILTIIIALTVAIWWMLPPPRRSLTVVPDPLTVTGVLHVHTRRSDGTGTPEDVARAAARAGLDFVALSDHGDGTQFMDAPRYIDGVLVLDGVEISTSAGHYIALGMPRAPYRLAGQARDVIDDVRRLGGFGIAAHPDSPKMELSWRNWQASFDALEWLNADSQWRDEPQRALVRTVLTYWLRGPESIVTLFDRPPSALAQWDALTRRRPVVAVAGHDAHARMSLAGAWEPTGNERSLALPSYETAFAAFAVRATLARPWGRASQDAGRDAAALLDALREGRVYTVIDAIAGPARLMFSATAPNGTTEMGGEVAATGAITMRADVTPDVPQATVVIVRNGRDFRTARGSSLLLVHPAGEGAATYRVEVRLDGAPGAPPVPWIVGNPIYVTRGAPRDAPPPLGEVLGQRMFEDGSGEVRWEIERHPQCAGRVDVVAAPADTRRGAGASGQLDPKFHKQLRFSWRIAAGPRASQYAAMATRLDGRKLRVFNQLAFYASASRPMRLSVQLRLPDGRRWQRSVYLDETPREITVPMSEMSSVAPGRRRMHLERADSLLFVVDTVNTPPGTAGQAWFQSMRWQQVKRQEG